MDEIRLRNEIGQLKQKVIKDLKSLNSNVEMLRFSEETPGATTLDAILLLLIKAEFIDNKGVAVPGRSRRF